MCFSVQRDDKSGHAVGPFQLDVRPDQISTDVRPELLLVFAGPRVRQTRGTSGVQAHQRRPFQRFQASHARILYYMAELPSLPGHSKKNKSHYT